MRITKICGGVFLLALLFAGSATGGEMTGRRYVEDFTTKEHCDTVQTVALWDTVAGHVTLYPFEITPVGSFNTPGVAYAVAVAGDYAFVADYSAGVMSIDISDPSNPQLAGLYNTSGSAFELAVSGDLLYVADLSGGLVVLDISNPESPFSVGNYSTAGIAYDIFIDGDYAYVADGTNGLVILDISIPSTPALIGHFNTAGTSYGVEVAGDHAYVADSGNGLQVIDVSDPGSPALVGHYYTSGYSWDVDVEGDMVYLADDNGGMYAIEIINPAKPKFIGRLVTPSPALGIEVHGDLAYIACQNSGLLVVDITDPATPFIKNSYNTSGASYDVTVAGEYAFVADAAPGLQVLDVRNTTSLDDCSWESNPSGCFVDLVVEGDIAYLADNERGLVVFDVSSRTEISSLPISGIGRCVNVEGNVAYVADYLGYFFSMDISDPSAPAVIDSIALPDTIWDVTIDGDHAFIGCVDFGVQVVDISDPSNMFIAGSYFYDPGSKISVVEVCGNMLFAGTTKDVLILDITNPASPSLIQDLFLDLEPTHFAVSGDYLYAITAYRLYVIDISNPSLPAMISNVYLGSSLALGLAVSGDKALISCDSILRMYDLSDPFAPVQLAYDIWGAGFTVCLQGEYSYMAAMDRLAIIKVFESNVSANIQQAYSLEIDGGDEDIAAIRVSLDTDPYGSVDIKFWDGSIYNDYSITGDYRFFASYRTWGNELKWILELNYDSSDGSSFPAVTNLEIDWLYESAFIDSIVDVPGDQGGWARIHFTKSAYEIPEAPEEPVTGYNIFRRVDYPLMAAAGVDTREEFPSVEIEGREFVTADAAAAAGLPPGDWEAIGYVMVLQQEEYIYLVPTLEDSSAVFDPTVCCIVAQTADPLVWYTSRPDSGYSVDNIAPGVPLGLSIAYNTGSGNTLDWDDSPEEDFQYYRIYRGDSEDFVPDPESITGEIAVSGWTDPEYDGWNVFYKVTALDYAGNESDPAGGGTVTDDEIPELPESFLLYQNVPNPFNPATTIRFDLPKATNVRLSVYNAKGELVATLINRHMSEGRKEIGWMARDNRGRAVSSGIYFYRLVAGDFVQTKKMVLIQ